MQYQMDVSAAQAPPATFDSNHIIVFSWEQFVTCFPTWVKEEAGTAGEIRMQISRFMKENLVVRRMDTSLFAYFALLTLPVERMQ